MTEFPLLVRLNSSCGINDFDASPIFDEIGDNYNYTAYSLENGTRLYFEVEYWNTTEESAFIWVKIPAISATENTTVYLWFEKFVDGSAYNNASMVWDNNFVMVQHMNDATTSTILDSTSNDNAGTKTAANEPIEAVGKIGSDQDFAPDNDQVTITDNTSLDIANAITLSALVNGDVFVHGMQFVGKQAAYMLAKRLTAPTDGVYFQVYVDGAYRYPNAYASQTISAGSFYKLDMTYDSVTRTINAYINGSLIDSKLLTGLGSYTIGTNNNNLFVGGRYIAWYDGKIDEVRLSNIARSTAWIGVSYETQRDNLIYYSGPEKGYSTDEVLGVAAIALVVALMAAALVLIYSSKK